MMGKNEEFGNHLVEWPRSIDLNVHFPGSLRMPFRVR